MGCCCLEKDVYYCYMSEPLLSLDEGETIGVYLILRSLEGEGLLDPDMQRLLQRIERVLYERMTIQELENLEQRRDCDPRKQTKEGRRR